MEWSNLDPVKQAKYLPITDTGQSTLEMLSQQSNFNRWMYETIRPYCSGQTLEIGSGIGNISQYFLEENYPLFLSDVDSHYYQQLQHQFKNHPCVQQILKVDLVHPDFENAYASLLGRFDTVFSLNVIEHISDDRQALQHCRQFLKRNGTLLILVPAYNLIYNPLDKNLGHYRRYTCRKLDRLFQETGLKVIHSSYFNALGIVGWVLSGSLLRHQSISGFQMSLYNKLSPFGRILDNMLRHKVGLSVIMVGKNP